MRSIASCVSSTAETFFAINAADSSTALLKLHSDLATTLLLLSLRGDDAKFGQMPQPPFDRDCHANRCGGLRRPDQYPHREHDRGGDIDRGGVSLHIGSHGNRDQTAVAAFGQTSHHPLAMKAGGASWPNRNGVSRARSSCRPR